MELTRILVGKYAEIIQVLQKQIPLRMRVEEQITRLEGGPVSFVFSRPIVDLKKFVERLLNPASPFKLLGMPVFISAEYGKALAVDTHTGGSMDVELSKDWLRVYMRGACCANSLLRLYTNLQHYYDAQVKATYFGEQNLVQL